MREEQPVEEGNRRGCGGDDGGGSTMGSTESERVREMQLSIAASSSVFPGFRFSPTDDELISYYLKKKLQGCDNCVDIIPEVDFCRQEPWDLPGLSVIRSDNEWFFFSTRGKKYPNGSQSKRATKSGYWKATGKERNVKSGADTIGTKRTLVFHMGRAPKGERTEWIMHEYCMSETSQEALVVCRLRRNSDFRINESSRGSSDQGISSAADSYYPAATNERTSTALIDVDGFGEGNAMKSFSMESKSSHQSDSVELNDSESVSDQQLLHGGCSTPYKEGDDEDDCFADIMNDDIVKLDESASRSLMFHGMLTGSQYADILPPETVTAQGTAVRSVKLKQQKHRPTEHEKASSSGDHNRTSDKNEAGCVFSVLGGNANTLSMFRPAYVVLLLIVVLIAWQANWMEVSRRQLRYWLCKAVEYI